MDGEVRFSEGKLVIQGLNASNNVAEYSGFCAVLDYLLCQKLRGVVIIRGDSKLVIQQMNGLWKVHGGHYVPFYHKAKHLLTVLRERNEGNVKMEWIPREENGECDEFSKDVLRRMGIKFKIQPEEPKNG